MKKVIDARLMLTPFTQEMINKLKPHGTFLCVVCEQPVQEGDILGKSVQRKLDQPEYVAFCTTCFQQLKEQGLAKPEIE